MRKIVAIAVSAILLAVAYWIYRARSEPKLNVDPQARKVIEKARTQ